MNKVNQVEVLIDKRTVGKIALTPNQLCAFEYDGKWLEDGFDYLCKTSQLFIFSNMKNGRRFQISQPLKPQTRGRPRKNHLELNAFAGDEV